MRVGIIGNGFVGQATKLIRCSIVEYIYIYDIIPEKCEPPGLSLDRFSECDIIFIAVPTPMEKDGKCNINIVENSINELNKIIDRERTFIVLRSTVPPGTSKRLDVYFMPEFLTEKKWEDDFINCKHWIIGCDSDNQLFKEKIIKLFDTAWKEGILKYNNISFIPTNEAELIKYVRNCFLALKVSFYNEIEEFCRIKKIDFETVRYFSTLDDRIGPSHSYVPGRDNLRGYGGSCFSKDTHALLYEIGKNGMESFVIKGFIERNETVDRIQNNTD